MKEILSIPKEDKRMIDEREINKETQQRVDDSDTRIDFKSVCDKFINVVNYDTIKTELDECGIRPLCSDEKYVAYLWLASRVNYYSLANRWGALPIQFPDNPRSLCVAFSVAKYINKKRGKTDDELVKSITETFSNVAEIVQLKLYIDSKSTITNPKLLGMLRHNRYVNLYREMEIELLGHHYNADDTMGLTLFATADCAKSLDNTAQICILIVKMIYTFILKAYPDYAFNLVLDNGFARELPYDIIRMGMILLNQYLDDFDRTFYSDDDIRYKGVLKAYRIVKEELVIGEGLFGDNLLGYTENDVDKVVNEIIRIRFTKLDVFNAILSSISD